MAMLAYDTFHGLEHIFDYLDVVDLVHSEVGLCGYQLRTLKTRGAVGLNACCR
jgi:hypothetical protein